MTTLASWLAAALLAGAVPTTPSDDAHAAFAAFRLAAAAEARRAGDEPAARALTRLVPGPVPADLRPAASRLLRSWLLARYGERLAPDLSALLRFRTLREEGETRWDAPEFARQRAWLEARARELGLEFRSFDGRVEEITLPGGKRTIAMVAHGDVVGVEGQAWSAPPWEGRIVGDRVVGRGAMDDKGPLVPALFALAAIRDSGFSVGATLKLVVPESEETDWSDVKHYLERVPPPEAAIGLDGTFAVTHGQKAGAIVKLTGEAGAESPGGTWKVLSLSSGIAPNVVPDLAKALLEARAGEGTPAEQVLAERARIFAAGHRDARISVARTDAGLEVTARGRAGHAAIPQNAHNALADLTAFLGSLDLVLDRWGALAAFLGRTLGTETDGRGLGIAHRDEVMGALTVNLGMVRDEKGVPTAYVDARVPRGMDEERLRAGVGAAAAEFGRRTGARVDATVRLSRLGPYLVPPDAPIVAALSRSWTEVTGLPATLVVTGGGTQARLFPNGVDFGPAFSVEEDRSHQADEYMTVPELKRVGELLVTALFRLAADGEEAP